MDFRETNTIKVENDQYFYGTYVYSYVIFFL